MTKMLSSNGIVAGDKTQVTRVTNYLILFKIMVEKHL